ncbi:PTS sugar transporter subunit IIC [Liquorilactobacillus capillatus]|uniref:PTS EIIC type-3 domain-containing protein n=1 Tax=Liquorilactobacillus capillatus DSM 19910 TaxID=1423731 RepID=A0A0R1MAS6_9LACO|nr:PTS sugar transporter subunit IIC [Liquorilactobacillus capillatus]KRL01091.1 hypothetical protein FC81_GL001230 [Liquorilactobacillus capillatus DSM 19910]
MRENRLWSFLYKLQDKQQKWLWLRSCYFGLKTTGPLLLLGILLQGLTLSFFQPHGFFYVIYRLDRQVWVPQANFIIHSLSCIVFGMTLLLLCTAVAWYRARLFSKKETIPSMVIALFLLFLFNFHTKRMPSARLGQVILNGNIPFIEVLFLGLVSAYFYHGLNKFLHFKSLWSIAGATVSLGIVLRGFKHLFNVGFFASLSGPLFAEISSLLGDDQTQLGTIIVREVGRNLLVWLGFVSPEQILVAHTDSDLSRANLSAALIKNNLEGLPHPLNIYSLSDSFAVLGGYGQIMALLLLFILFSRYRKRRRNAWQNFLPVFLNLNSSFLVGVPVFFNVILLIPFLIVPTVSILLAAGAIKLNLIPPAVYQVPLNTPTILNAFMGTNGNWDALLFTLIVLLVSMLLYYPFFKVTETTLYRIQKGTE